MTRPRSPSRHRQSCHRRRHLLRYDGRQPCAVQGLPAYGRLRERWLANPMPTATAAATHGQRRGIGAGSAALLLVLLLRPVVSLHGAAGLRSKSGDEGLRSDQGCVRQLITVSRIARSCD